MLNSTRNHQFDLCDCENTRFPTNPLLGGYLLYCTDDLVSGFLIIVHHTFTKKEAHESCTCYVYHHHHCSKWPCWGKSSAFVLTILSASKDTKTSSSPRTTPRRKHKPWSHKGMCEEIHLCVSTFGECVRMLSWGRG